MSFTSCHSVTLLCSKREPLSCFVSEQEGDRTFICVTRWNILTPKVEQIQRLPRERRSGGREGGAV